MPTIAEVGSVRIIMFQRDHNPPHIHAFGTDFEAKFAIYPFEVMVQWPDEVDICADDLCQGITAA
jgi:hypothetical protein